MSQTVSIPQFLWSCSMSQTVSHCQRVVYYLVYLPFWYITSYGHLFGKSPFPMEKTMEHHHFQWKNYGKSQFFMGKFTISAIFDGTTTGCVGGCHAAGCPWWTSGNSVAW